MPAELPQISLLLFFHRESVGAFRWVLVARMQVFLVQAAGMQRGWLSNCDLLSGSGRSFDSPSLVIYRNINMHTKDEILRETAEVIERLTRLMVKFYKEAEEEKKRSTGRLLLLNGGEECTEGGANGTPLGIGGVDES